MNLKTAIMESDELLTEPTVATASHNASLSEEFSSHNEAIIDQIAEKWHPIYHGLERKRIMRNKFFFA